MVHIVDTAGWQHLLHGVHLGVLLQGLGPIHLLFSITHILGLAITNCFPLFRHDITSHQELLENITDYIDDDVDDTDRSDCDTVGIVTCWKLSSAGTHKTTV